MSTVAATAGLDALCAVRPAWCALRTGAEALGLVPGELLHAGPPLHDPRSPPAPLRSAAVLTALHEGWASDEAQAEAMLADGWLRLRPAQTAGCVTPLAAVVSAGTPLFGVGDAASHTGHAGGPAADLIWAPVSALRGPDTRMGHRDPAVLARLTERDRVLAPALAQWLAQRGPLPLWPLAAQGLAGGDDLHSRTAAANAALVAAWQGGLPAALSEALGATPLFFLTLWMAACARLLRAAEGGDAPDLITRAGGNGERFGIALAGHPSDWISVPAAAPAGWRLPSAPAQAQALGAIGDSAVIDLLGFGAQRLAHAPEPLSVLAAGLPPGGLPDVQRLLERAHPALQPPWSLGIRASRVKQTGIAPMVALAMVAADGRTGLLGRGLYRPPMALFNAAG